jgi:hypothetical protein
MQVGFIWRGLIFRKGDYKNEETSMKTVVVEVKKLKDLK